MCLSIEVTAFYLSSTVGIGWGKCNSGTSHNETAYIGLWKFCKSSGCVKYNEDTVESKQVDYIEDISISNI